jgi:hypothetical protein
VGVAGKVFTAVAEAGVNVRMISQGASEINISFVAHEDEVAAAVRHLHEVFFESGAAVVERRAAASVKAGASVMAARNRAQARQRVN